MFAVFGSTLLFLTLAPESCSVPSLPQKDSPGLGNYKASSGGLKDQIKAVFEAEKKGDKESVSSQIKSMLLPRGNTWFSEVFGETLGSKVSEAYEKVRERHVKSLESDFASAVRQKRTDIRVFKFEDDCATDANEDEYPVLLARKKKEPLYVVQLSDSRMYLSLRFFAYVDGAFRFVDVPAINFYSPVREPAPPGVTRPKMIRVGGSVQQESLVHQEPPVYPERARSRGLQGRVLMTVIIDVNGNVRDVEVIRGHCWLAEAAVYAMKKWRYKPTFYEGVAAEVVTTVEMGFSLGLRP